MAADEGKGEKSMAQVALRWILEHPAVTLAIPGCRTARHVADNMSASDLPSLSKAEMAAINDIYEDLIRIHVHGSW